MGSFAIQIAKALGAEVTGVCSARNVDLVRSLGAALVASSYDPAEEFLFGLDLILAALEPLRASA